VRRPHEVLVFVHGGLWQFLALQPNAPEEVCWHVVAGALEQDESPSEAAARELQDEVGPGVDGLVVDLRRRYRDPSERRPPGRGWN